MTKLLSKQRVNERNVQTKCNKKPISWSWISDSWSLVLDSRS